MKKTMIITVEIEVSNDLDFADVDHHVMIKMDNICNLINASGLVTDVPEWDYEDYPE